MTKRLVLLAILCAVPALAQDPSDAFETPPAPPIAMHFTSSALLARIGSGLATGQAPSANDLVEEVLAEDSADATKPSIGTMGAWCWADKDATTKKLHTRCDSGGVFNAHAWQSRILRGRYAAVAMVASPKSIGFGLGWELFKYVAPAAGQRGAPRIFVGGVVVAPLGGLGKMTLSPGLCVAVRL